MAAPIVAAVTAELAKVGIVNIAKAQAEIKALTEQLAEAKGERDALSEALQAAQAEIRALTEAHDAMVAKAQADKSPKK